jgi:hypothetical protein
MKLQITMFERKKAEPISMDLPRAEEPLNCAFQRRGRGNKINCGLTVSSFEPCLIDICPMYQTWTRINIDRIIFQCYMIELKR